MITDYYRPETLDEALKLLQEPGNVPLAGGTILSRHVQADIGVVDLQKLGLNTIEPAGNRLMIGAAVVLQDLIESDATPEIIQQAASLEGGWNSRNSASVGGTIVSADGKSPLLTVLLAMDATLVFAQGDEEISLGNWLPLRSLRDASKLILQVVISGNPQAKYQQVGRTPKDIALASAAVAQWPSGRTRIALGGRMPAPLVAMDGTDAGGAVVAAQDAYSHYATTWASREYLDATVATLVSRLMADDGRQI